MHHRKQSNCNHKIVNKFWSVIAHTYTLTYLQQHGRERKVEKMEKVKLMSRAAIDQQIGIDTHLWNKPTIGCLSISADSSSSSRCRSVAKCCFSFSLLCEKHNQALVSMKIFWNWLQSYKPFSSPILMCLTYVSVVGKLLCIELSWIEEVGCT